MFCCPLAYSYTHQIQDASNWSRYPHHTCSSAWVVPSAFQLPEPVTWSHLRLFFFPTYLIHCQVLMMLSFNSLYDTLSLSITSFALAGLWSSEMPAVVTVSLLVSLTQPFRIHNSVLELSSALLPIMWKARLNESQAGSKTVGRNMQKYATSNMQIPLKWQKVKRN